MKPEVKNIISSFIPGTIFIGLLSLIKYYEVSQQVEFMQWATDKSLYSFAQFDQLVKNANNTELNSIHQQLGGKFSVKSDRRALFDKEMVNLVRYYSDNAQIAAGNAVAGIWDYYRYAEKYRFKISNGKEGLDPNIAVTMKQYPHLISEYSLKRQFDEIYARVSENLDIVEASEVSDKSSEKTGHLVWWISLGVLVLIIGGFKKLSSKPSKDGNPAGKVSKKLRRDRGNALIQTLVVVVIRHLTI